MTTETIRIITYLKSDLDIWYEEINYRIKKNKKSVTREALFNFMVLSEFLSSIDFSEADIMWLLIELLCGKFEFYLNLADNEFSVTCKQYIQLKSNEILNDNTHFESIFYKKYGLRHDKIDEFKVQIYNFFKIDYNQKINFKRKFNSNCKYGSFIERGTRVFELENISDSFLSFLLEDKLLEFIQRELDDSTLYISHPSSHCNHIDPEDGFAFFIQSEKDKLTTRQIGELVCFLY